MNSSFLLPHRFKQIGWILLSIGILAGLYWLLIDSEPTWSNSKVFVIYEDQPIGKDLWFTFQENTILDEVASVLLIVGGWLVAFSRETVEDEFIARIRLDCLAWAIHINYLVLLITIAFIYGMTFFYVMVFNMFTPLLFFIIRFRWLIWKHSNKIEA
ncbi:hypothetical protein [Thermaurantimonas aggregans]|uniref:hypothetical protein n=1 Tax=Thermaurantimonas aggregans TaxID=2173829 RepID=UPI0023F5114F|nr:hypothetical protein [Thermaurantimonas aggregans]MCX8147998.1 hypothetical protein [Thermaurantimonas aggregans]